MIFTWRAFLVLMPATVRTWLESWEAAPWEREARRMMTTETIRWWRNSHTVRLSDTWQTMLNVFQKWGKSPLTCIFCSWPSVVSFRVVSSTPGNSSVWSLCRAATTTWIPRAPPKPRKSASNLGNCNCYLNVGNGGNNQAVTVGNEMFRNSCVTSHTSMYLERLYFALE